YFEGTPQELEIYKIFGRHEGPTMMILGGIQGDEPGGFLSADLYVDLALKRGNLIVVPRANFKSIILYDRGPDGDMNRKFDGVQDHDPDRDAVEILKNLMAESDILLNLHDGSGFFRPVWESDMANPSRYGQCIIADAEVYVHPPTGRVMHLGQEARQVADVINLDIAEEKYKFSFSNHDTLSKSTKHPEQRKSATYYALTKLGIPAYGIETSKQLPTLEMKILQHNLAVNAFMELYGIVPEQPRIHLDSPMLSYLVISVNGQLPVAVADGQTLLVAPGDTVEVVHVGANYDRGLSVDVLGLGSLNDVRVPLVINRPTVVIARRDNVKFGQVKLELLPPGQRASSPQLLALGPAEVVKADAGQLPGAAPAVEAAPGRSAEASPGAEPAGAAPDEPAFLLEVDGQPARLAAEKTLSVRRGARVKMVGLAGQFPSGTVMNLRGFVGKAGDVTGDDLGATADTARDMLPRFALARSPHFVYQLGAEDGPRILAKAYLALVSPKLKSVTLEVDGQGKVLSLGQRWGLKPGTKLTLKAVELEGELPLVAPRFTLGGRAFPADLPQVLTMPAIAVSLAVFSDGELAGKVVLAPLN
ncbi:MAG: hypothetical protein LBU12_00210, partial [Deltaproteobacteria bacterium]|nr:hypothetical protein [Deltaproteobacteria bacterium]